MLDFQMVKCTENKVLHHTNCVSRTQSGVKCNLYREGNLCRVANP